MAATSITIHNTSNPSSTAANERGWLTNPANARTASFHIVVDEREAIECIQLNESAWHAGDGSGMLSGNRTSIGIELCESGDYAKTLRNAAKLVAKLLLERGWGVDRLKRHYDWSGKICPRLMYDNGSWTGWQLFKQQVADSMGTRVEDEPMADADELAIDELRAEIAKLKGRVAELEASATLIEAPPWFVTEFDSGDLGGKLHEPKLSYEGWRVLAISLRMQKN